MSQIVVSLFVACAALSECHFFGDVGESLFVSGAAFGDLWFKHRFGWVPCWRIFFPSPRACPALFACGMTMAILGIRDDAKEEKPEKEKEDKGRQFLEKARKSEKAPCRRQELLGSG